MSEEIILRVHPGDLQNILLALNEIIETPKRLSWVEKRELFQLGDRLLFQSQNQPSQEEEANVQANTPDENSVVESNGAGDMPKHSVPIRRADRSRGK